MTDTERQAYEQKMDARLMKWDAQMQELKARAKEAGADAKVEIARELDELEKRSDAAREKLRLLGVTAGERGADHGIAHAEPVQRGLELGLEMLVAERAGGGEIAVRLAVNPRPGGAWWLGYRDSRAAFGETTGSHPGLDLPDIAARGLDQVVGRVDLARALLGDGAHAFR